MYICLADRKTWLAPIAMHALGKMISTHGMVKHYKAGHSTLLTHFTIYKRPVVLTNWHVSSYFFHPIFL